MKKQGFTLAEVLTTLMVIGVVAAMTIPTLMNSTDNQQNKVALKKAISVLGQAVQLNIAKEVECTAATGNDNGSDALAACMAHSLAGAVRDNTISTPDGMVYAFYADGFATGDIATECGGQFDNNSVNALKGAGQCGVVVDVNGFAKGKKSIGTVGENNQNDVSFGANGFSDAAPQSGDQYSLVLTAAGAKPIYTAKADSIGYGYIYGEPASDDDVLSTSTICYSNNYCTDNLTETVSGFAGGSCPTNYSATKPTCGEQPTP